MSRQDLAHAAMEGRMAAERGENWNRMPYYFTKESRAWQDAWLWEMTRQAVRDGRASLAPDRVIRATRK